MQIVECKWVLSLYTKERTNGYHKQGDTNMVL
jgi:hypothetical protein